MSTQKPREIAARVLLQRRTGADFVENLLEAGLAKAALSPADRGLCQELVYGVVRWQRTLDELIARKTGGRPQRPGLQVLLRLGLYQIFWLDRVPNHAAVHETVEMARRTGFAAQAGFINAVLRGYTREEDETRRGLQRLRREAPALGYSHPDWLFERWSARWGGEDAVRLLAWNNTPPPGYARVNTIKTSAEKLTAQWREEHVEFSECAWPWTGGGSVYELKEHPPVATLPSFQQGLFYIQDPGTLLAVNELDPQPGETILDVCCAPGGKTTHVAQRMQNRGTIVARDIHPGRLEMVRENCVRMGVTCVDASMRFDAVEPGPAGRFDRILIDAPCSNTGVLRRRIELRWRIRLDEIQRLHGAQLDILRKAAPRLKPGGVLIYSTCSLEPEENRAVVDAFVTECPDFELDDERELLPFRDGVDGAYVAKLKRATSIGEASP